MLFHKTPTRRERYGFVYHLWTSLDRRYAVERSRYAPHDTMPRKPTKMPDVWRALRRDGKHWAKVSNHRTRHAAERAAARAQRAAA